MMNDLLKAKQAVVEDGLSLSVYLEGQCLYCSHDAGIKPMYLAYTQGFDFTGAAGADKVVGLGAAAFWAAMHIGRLHAVVISDPALDFLIENGTDVTYDTLVPKIKNREGTGFCPVETLALASDSFEDFVKETQAFLTRINQL